MPARPASPPATRWPQRRDFLQALAGLFGGAAADDAGAWLRARTLSVPAFRWVAFYGETADEQVLAGYDLVVLDRMFRGVKAEITQRGARLFGYLSLGLILDSFHTLSLNDDPHGILEIPGEKLFFVQMADAPLLAMDVLQWARHHRSFPGQGDFDCVGFFELALRAGYTGPLSLEIFNDVFRETPNRRTAVDAMRSLLWLESQVRDRLVSVPAVPAPARATPTRTASLSAPIPR